MWMYNVISKCKKKSLGMTCSLLKSWLTMPQSTHDTFLQGNGELARDEICEKEINDTNMF